MNMRNTEADSEDHYKDPNNFEPVPEMLKR